MMLTDLTLTGSVIVSAIAALLIGLFGTRLSTKADVLADRTGIGEALVGAVLLGACTSLPGITASVTAAYHGYAQLALSNAYGGIAAQTAFLAIADMVYKKANLEHASASLSNILFGVLLVVLLSLSLLAMVGPEASLWGVHPVTPALFVVYICGMRVVARSGKSPMWRPRLTAATKIDTPEKHPGDEASTKLLLLDFLISACIIISAG